MYDFILQLSIVISLSVIIYLLAGAVARFKDDDLVLVGGENSENNFLDNWLDHGYIAKIDEWFGSVIAKFLRRLRVIILKLDNLVSHHIRQSNNNRNHKPNLMDDLNGKDKSDV